MLESVSEALMLRHYSVRTREAYVGWVRRFVVFHHLRHPQVLGPREVSAFLSHLAREGQVTASTQNQALAALLFLYGEVLHRPLEFVGGIVHAKRPVRLPVVLSREEVKAVLDQLSGTWQLMASLLYGSGLRLLECVSLRVKDVDFSGAQILVRRAKGQKDRVTLLPQRAVEPLRAHLLRVSELHQSDLSDGAGMVDLPGALRVKYPNAARDWPWQWVFPATRRYVCESSGEQRRHHIHETALQRAVRSAVVAAGLSIYTHVLRRGPLGVKSPLDH